MEWTYDNLHILRKVGWMFVDSKGMRTDQWTTSMFQTVEGRPPADELAVSLACRMLGVKCRIFFKNRFVFIAEMLDLFECDNSIQWTIFFCFSSQFWSSSGNEGKDYLHFVFVRPFHLKLFTHEDIESGWRLSFYGLHISSDSECESDDEEAIPTSPRKDFK